MGIELPTWAAELRKPHRFKSVRGGRGGAKSWTVARELLLQAAQRKLRILCAREFQNSIQDSVHKLLSEQASELGLGAFYDVQQAVIRGRNGSEFIFAGLRNNVASIKSKEGIDICWVEEAQTVSEASWATLIPTIRKDKSEIWLTWNPENDDDPSYRRFVAEPPPDCWSVLVNWDSNPWFPEVLARERDHLYAVDPDAADWIWGGNCRKVSVAQVLRGRWVVEAFEPKQDWHGPYYGADWGFSVDPTVLIKCWVSGRKLYIEREAYGVGVDIEDTPRLFDSLEPSADKEKPPIVRKHTIRADSARPETISHMRRHGFPSMLGVSKRPGSVEDGVEHLRSYEQIVIHPRCTNAAVEAKLWSYKIDKLSGDVLPVLVDKHDHCWDAIRYALEPVIRAGKPVAPPPKPAPTRSDYTPRKSSSERWKVV